MNKDKTKGRARRGRLVILFSMSPSRTARLYFLLVLDLLFFVLEISIGKLSRSSEGSSC
jgi:Co/Zn/Cd efflux system component